MKYIQTSEKGLVTLGAVLMVVFVLILLGVAIMWLWNWLMPYLFALPTINYWQGLGILMLSNILFKNNSGGTNKE